MRSLPRITIDDFRGRLRGFGSADVHGPEPLAIEGFDRIAATGAHNVRSAFLAKWNGAAFVLPTEQMERMRRNATELQRRRVYLTPLLCIPEDEHIHLWRGDANAVESFLEIWRTITRAFRGRTVVAGFDLLNEPKLTGPAQDVPYWALMRATVDAVRELDSRRICIVSTWPGGLCQTNPEWGQWIEHIPGTVLTAHLYSPFEYTHAGLVDWVGAGKDFDPYMHTTLQAVHTALLWLRDHSIKSGQPVWIGEFSTQQDRPGAAEWARHAVEMCRAFGFSWSWHYFIGWPGWHPNADTLEVLKAAFKAK